MHACDTTANSSERKYMLKLDLQLFAEKTENATPQKRRETRQKGQVAKSQELPGALLLFFTFLSFYVFGGFMKTQLYKMINTVLTQYLTMEVTINNVMTLFAELTFQFVLLIAPVLGTAFLIAIVGNYVQVGILFSADGLKMKFSKINPLQGFKKMFGMRTLVELLKSVVKLVIIGLVVYLTLKGEMTKLLALADVPLIEIWEYVASIVLSLGLKAGIFLSILAMLDFMYQKYSFEKSIKMSKQDIKDEYKKSEGDPLIKGKIREKQRQMAMKRMMAEVPKADVIITNPTHFAVAIKYNQDEMETPIVVAKGQDNNAQKIKEIAKEHNIVTIENKPLARALYSQVEVGRSIPPDLFQAVAEILAYVYKLRKKR